MPLLCLTAYHMIQLGTFSFICHYHYESVLHTDLFAVVKWKPNGLLVHYKQLCNLLGLDKHPAANSGSQPVVEFSV